MIDTSKQGFAVKYKNKKFKTQSGFKRWLNKNGKYIISFVDKGQDCLEWVIDEQGEVLHANIQSGVWNGHIVNLKTIKVGKEIGVFDTPNERTKFYDFVIRSIINTNEL